jgi:hypothetical protein
MMIIRTRCSRCGEVDVRPESILLLVPEKGADGSYRFTCPVCERDVENWAESKIVALLVSAGVEVVEGTGSTAQVVAEGDPPVEVTSTGALPASSDPLSEEAFVARAMLYEEMLGTVARVMTIAEATRPDGSGQGDPDREHVVRDLTNRIEATGSQVVSVIFERWAMTQFRFFIQREIRRRLEANGEMADALHEWRRVQESRQELRAITTQLERRVSDELRR